MAADSSGRFRVMLRVSWVARLTSRGRTWECAGTSRTSSKVRAFCSSRMAFDPRSQNRIIQKTFEKPDDHEQAADSRPCRRVDRDLPSGARADLSVEGCGLKDDHFRHTAAGDFRCA